MAVTQINVTVGANDPNGVPLAPSPSGVGDPVSQVPATTTIAADIATLVADGASPTQAHVNTLNTNWTTYLASITSYKSGVLGGNVAVSFDGAHITTLKELRAALAAAYLAAQQGVGGLK